MYTYSIIGLNIAHLGTDDEIKRLFRGFYRLRPPQPKSNNAWEVSGLLNYIETNYIHQNDFNRSSPG